MKNLAIITARGGSKRIPRKNIKPFLGQPIIAYSIETALKTGIFEEVMVSTDDNEIAEIAKQYGATIPFKRSNKNSDDHATTNDVILEVIKEYSNQERHFDYACCIYPTAPLIHENTLKLAYEKVQTNEYDLVLPVAPFGYPIQRSFIKNELGHMKYAFPENINKRSQDLPKHYHDAGQFYFFNVKSYIQRNQLIGEKMFGIELSELQVQDIDNEEDWKLAEMKFNLLNTMEYIKVK